MRPIRTASIGAVAEFRDTLAWIRDSYPHKLLCPTAWEEFLLGGLPARPVRWAGLSGGVGWPSLWATVPTYNGKTGQATCAQPSFSRAQWDSTLDMIVDVGREGVFYWATANSWGKYFTDPNEPGIGVLLDLAGRLGGALPQGNHSATF